jgi:lipopolysaccharide/colanic/teichoic acid biosynthesis glycosyltransferase
LLKSSFVNQTEAPLSKIKVSNKKFLINNNIENQSEIITTKITTYHYFYSYLKRMIDSLLAIGLLFVFWPLFLLVAILIRIDSKGPIFYIQKRAGKDNKNFLIYKFRTMEHNSEGINDSIFRQNNNLRITDIGKFLRYTNLDELPQLINILKGEMSFVGPRPEWVYSSEIFSKYIADWPLRLKVKPGITGLAQLKGFSSLEPIQKLEQDLIYIENYSLKMDVKILFKTIVFMLKNYMQGLENKLII